MIASIRRSVVYLRRGSKPGAAQLERMEGSYWCLNATICARYRCGAVNVHVAAIDPAVVCTRSSVATSPPTDACCVKLVPGVIVVGPVSSMTAANIRSPLTVVTPAVVVMPLVVVVPLALFIFVTSTGFVVAIPLYSWMRIRRYGALPLNVAVTVVAPPLMLGAKQIPSD